MPAGQGPETAPEEQASRKRILPAIILVGIGILGAHRIYAGRYVSGLAQLALLIAGVLMIGRDLSGIGSLQTIDDVQNWVLTHQLHPLPILLISVATFWAVGDCILLAARRFRDGSGRVMTRWI